MHGYLLVAETQYGTHSDDFGDAIYHENDCRKGILNT